ncbi:MAG: hypothetical protein KC448_00850 [Yoonia sp.]|nr:hypothetical protein [Yoonia sp.]
MPTACFDLVTPAPFHRSAQIKCASEIYDAQPGVGASGRLLRADALWLGAGAQSPAAVTEQLRMDLEGIAPKSGGDAVAVGAPLAGLSQWLKIQLA